MDGNNFSANSQNIKKFNLQQKAKTIMLVAIILVPLIIGAVAYGFYKNATKDPSNSTVLSDNDAIPDTVEPEDNIPDTDIPISAPSDQPATPAPSSSPGQAPAAAPSSGGMPAGVTTAINSIEASGLKGNPYVSVDTSELPDGASVKIDRGSWTQYGSDIGAINGTVTVGGEVKNGSLTFSQSDGTWRVTGYGLDA